MKKRILAVVSAMAVMAVSAFGCGSSSKDYSKNVTVGNYIGLEVTAIDTSVSDEELDETLASLFRDTVEDGDVINLDFDGYINGETFEGGSSDEDGYDLEIGSGALIDGFEDGLIGAKVGEEVSLDLTFPEEDYDEEFAGKDVTFVCVVNSIYGVYAPELTLEYVTENTDYTTIDEYKEYIRSQLIAEKEYNAESEQFTEILEKVMANCEVKKYPSDLLKAYREEAEAYFDSLIEQYNYYYYMYTGTTLSKEDMLTTLGYTQEDIDTAVEEASKDNAKSAMVFHVIADKEGIVLTEEEFEEALAQYMVDTGYETAEEFYEAYNYSEEVFKEDLLFDKVMDFIMENAVEVPATTTDDTTTE